MITDKQFDDAFTAAGGWFIAKYYTMALNWEGSKSELVDKIYLDGTDANRSGTNTRVSSLIRIIDNKRGYEALLKISESTRIAKQNPDSVIEAKRLLKEIF